MSDIINLARDAAARWPQIIGEPELVMHRENTVLRVATTSGPHALRLHRPGYHSAAALRSELAFTAMLARARIQVPVPAPAADGALLVTLPGQPPRLASLLSWLQGAPMGATGVPLAVAQDYRANLFRALGAEMARMHHLADGWTRPADFSRPAWDADGLVGDAPVWGPFWTIDAPAADVAMLLRIRDQSRVTLQDYAGNGGDYGLIHADLVRENVLMDGPNLRFIDFDDCGFGFRMFEIATVLLKNIDEPDAATLEAALLEGYRAVRPLAQRDLDMLPLFIILRSLTYLGWAQARPNDPDIKTRAARYLRIAKQVIATRMP